VTDRDPQTESQAQISGVIEAIKSLEGQIPGVKRAIESGEKWHIGATVASVFVAVIALALSAVVYFGSAKREADVAASEALMGHFEFAAQHPEPNKVLVAKHGIYTANIIVDLTEAPDERAPWHSTARTLLSKYKGHIRREGLPCDELDKQFVTLVKSTLDNKVECTNGGQPTWGTTSSWGRWLGGWGWGTT
jgi:hypothetical protein